MPTIAIALGSNLGDRAGHLDWAVDALRQQILDLRVSPYLETDPVGVPGDQPRFLNAAVAGETSVTAHEWLARLLALEHERGRRRDTVLAARTLDLDLILYGDATIDRPGLVVPHPRFRERRFVLEPLAAIAPWLVDPVTCTSVASLLAELDRREKPG